MTLVLLAVLFLIVYSWLYYGPVPKFTSPDETANYYFITHFANNSSLEVPVSTDSDIGKLITPRSMIVRDGYLVPGSFLGMILIYGLVAKIIGIKLILFATPLLSVVAVIFFYFLMKKIFSKFIAFISSLLLFVLPPFWYYSSRGMFHNIIFVDFLIIALYFLVCALTAQSHNKQWAMVSLAGLFIGLALITRTSEILWVGLVIVVIAVFSDKKIFILQWLTFTIIVMALFVPIIMLNHQLYGSFFTFAYSPSTISEGPVIGPAAAATNTTLFLKIRQLIIPFGIDIPRAADMAGNYLVKLLPWFSIGFICMLAWLVRKLVMRILVKYQFINAQSNGPFTRAQVLYAWFFVVVTLWLVLYYGAYTFHEYIDKSRIILGSSYLRYWLPIYVFSLPLIVLALENLGQLFTRKHWRVLITLGYITLFTLFSVASTLQDPLQGLHQLKKNIRNEQLIAETVFQETHVQSIIISGFADKVFFPERRVVVSLPSTPGNMSSAAHQLLDISDVFLYYNPLDSQTASMMEILSKQGFRFEKISTFSDDGTALYRVWST